MRETDKVGSLIFFVFSYPLQFGLDLFHGGQAFSCKGFRQGIARQKEIP